MPLSEREKKELAKKIAEQRRSVWKGEVTDKPRNKKRRERKKTMPVLDRQQDREEIEQTLEFPYQITEECEETKQILEEQRESEKEELAEKIKEQRRSMWKGEVTDKRRAKKQERKKTKPALDRQSNTPRSRGKSKDVQSKVPTLKLAFLVIIGLIAAIIMGVAIGYLVAIHDLIKI
jgi:predicted ribonuclease toxin of YeeF-YezG toxin-antitoxin module